MSTEMMATPANMRKLAGMRYGATLFAYSPTTYERFSATADDYWNQPDDEPLRDSQGSPMVLAFEHTVITIVSEGEVVA